MTRAELLHAARVEAYALALFNTGPVPTDRDVEQRMRQNYRRKAEQYVSEYERNGTFTADMERVA